MVEFKVTWRKPIPCTISLNQEKSSYLTPRKRQIIERIVDGSPTSNEQIAEDMNIGPEAVKKHLYEVSQKIEDETGTLALSKTEIIAALFSEGVLVLNPVENKPNI